MYSESVPLKTPSLVFSAKRSKILSTLSKEEIKPILRGKVHLYDAEDVNNEYRKNINRDVITAYHKAVEYTINRIKNYCNSRNANYLLVQSDKSVNEVFLKNLPEMGVLK